MDILVVNNKRYEKVDLSNDTSVLDGYFKDYEVPEDLCVRLSKELGFSYDLYQTLSSIDPKASKALVSCMSYQSHHTEVLLLVDDGAMSVINYSLDVDRPPVLNDEFIRRVTSLVETSPEIDIDEVHYIPDDTVSSLLIKKNSPIKLEEKYEGRDSVEVSYSIGVLLLNDEVATTSARLVLYVGGQPLYLPSSYYSTTTSRYKRSTSSSLEALEVLTLKVIDDLREDSLSDKMYEVHYKYRDIQNIPVSYEEYIRVLNSMRKVPTIIEEESVLDTLLDENTYLERRYPNLLDKKSSYIWRCTAMSEMTVGKLVDITTKIMTDLDAPSMEYFAVRDLLGSYISTSRIVSEIARG